MYIRAKKRGAVQLYTSNNVLLVCTYVYLEVRCYFFLSCNVTARPGLNATRGSTRFVHQQIQFFFLPKEATIQVH